MDIDGRLTPLRHMPEFVALMEQIQDDVSKAVAEIQSLSLAAL
jgi:hypothetical protein